MLREGVDFKLFRTLLLRYKNHTKVDTKSKLVPHYKVADASVHHSLVLNIC